MTDPPPRELERHLIDQVDLICDSYLKLVGRPLLPDLPPTGRALVECVGTSDRVVVSHDGALDPRFNYGNRAALRLWEMSEDEFVGLPSRYSAEEEHRGDRARLLREVAETGVSTNYSGIRASRTGRRFMIQRATVFNLIDASGEFRGQAATFLDWTFL